MTRLPSVSWDVTGVEGPKYKVGPKCAVASCAHWADHGHHLWRRSFLAGDFKWVRLWDGTVVQNLSALCFDHHARITENKAWVEYTDDGEFFYAEPCSNNEGETYTRKEVLVPQPRTLAEFQFAATVEAGDADVNVPVEEPACPTCGHKRKPRDLPAGEKRNRVSWTVSVPKDERENGAAVLDELEYACAEKLGRESHSSHKYYVLCEVLAAFLLGNVDVSDFVRGIDEGDGA